MRWLRSLQQKRVGTGSSVAGKKEIIDRIAVKLRGIRDLSGIELQTDAKQGSDIKDPKTLTVEQLTHIESTLVQMIKEKIDPTKKDNKFGLYQEGSFLIIPHAFLQSFGFADSGHPLATPEQAGVTTGRQGKSRDATPTHHRIKDWKPNPNSHRHVDDTHY
jgi:hypothetical protein